MRASSLIDPYSGYEYDGGIIITASHLPYNRNGFKFFTKEGGLEKGDIKSILRRAAAAAHASGMSPNARHSDDAQVIDAAINVDPSAAPQVMTEFQSFFFLLCCMLRKAGHADNAQVTDAAISIAPSSAPWGSPLSHSSSLSSLYSMFPKAWLSEDAQVTYAATDIDAASAPQVSG